ncbi:TB2/DP1, HVA22 family-domain-containing protein [Daldinia loculata]|uniref:TB2/DP1, HVA22 family-domain-containing protein n=1 Tax=Daldinia loculata TaxID=103429 RepID=UPI0020C343CF|nr:TB2/DP1, HVA22 family-domain-containing protein [Daldinia loculata]KAI1643139.1 TB2/DP1, HVA22 family-domain-containing protein [Daldinia loculata]KAI2784604.1 TB2/DP1, HVA22 family-domain-containing protein [Daldinia loculata]
MSAQDRVQHYISQLDRELSKYPALNNLEKQFGVPKVYAVLGVASLYLFFIIFNLGGQLLTNFAGFVVPGYYSLAALFSATKADDTQWLTYWVVFALFSVVESAVSVVYWFPFYYTFKFVFLLWLSLPMFSGAQLIFRSFLQPMLGRHFSESGSTAANLRAKADSFGKDQ